MTDVTLRPATAGDAPFLLQVREEPAARRYQPLRPYSLARLRQMLATRSKARLSGDFAGKAQWVIEVDSQPAGWVTLDVTSREHGVASMGYTLSSAFHGRGIATAAVHQLIEIAFDPDGLDLARLEAVAAVPNHASQRLLEKVGLRREGTANGLLVINGERVDHARFGLLRSEWSNARRQRSA